MPESPILCYLQPAAILHELAVMPSDLCSFGTAARKPVEETGECVSIEAEIGRELPQNRAEFLLKSKNTRSPEVRLGFLNILSRFMCVMKRLPFTENRKSDGVEVHDGNREELIDGGTVAELAEVSHAVPAVRS
jgi:hypothetical protein